MQKADQHKTAANMNYCLFGNGFLFIYRTGKNQLSTITDNNKILISLAEKGQQSGRMYKSRELRSINDYDRTN